MAINKINKNQIENITGGEIIKLDNGEFFICYNGKNLFADNRTFSNLEDALNILKEFNKMGININSNLITEKEYNIIQDEDKYLKYES